jgi:hypothetical protein
MRHDMYRLQIDLDTAAPERSPPVGRKRRPGSAGLQAKRRNGRRSAVFPGGRAGDKAAVIKLTKQNPTRADQPFGRDVDRTGDRRDPLSENCLGLGDHRHHNRLRGGMLLRASTSSCQESTR